MQSNLEQIKEMVRSLPAEDLDELQKVISEEKKAKAAKNGGAKHIEADIDRFKKSQRWLDENRENYMDQWVCLDADKLVAHSKDGREVYRKAKEAGIENPFVHYIQEEPEAYWGGWL
jgi:hypothetical protein